MTGAPSQVLFTADADAQGVFSLVQNLGSLVARIVFLPVEESSFAEFSRLLSVADIQQSDTDIRRRRLQEASTLLSLLLKFVGMIGAFRFFKSGALACRHQARPAGLVFVAFGPAYSFLALHTLYGARWSSTAAPAALSAYCLYVLLLAVNGISEAFVFSAISPSQLTAYNLWLAAFSMLYLVRLAASLDERATRNDCPVRAQGLCAALLRFGPLGIIAANSLSMSARIAYSLTFIGGYFATHTGTAKPTAAIASVLQRAAPAPRSVDLRGAYRFVGTHV